jgi:hypothetical protein
MGGAGNQPELALPAPQLPPFKPWSDLPSPTSQQVRLPIVVAQLQSPREASPITVSSGLEGNAIPRCYSSTEPREGKMVRADAGNRHSDYGR